MSRIVRTEVRKRGFMGKIVKWTFIGFNLLMLVWVGSYWMQLSEMHQSTADSAGQAGLAIGGTMGTGVLLLLWIAGAVILGLLTMMSRGKKTIIEESVE